MKKLLCAILIVLLVVSTSFVAYADDNSASPLGFARNYTVKNVNDTPKTIMSDINAFSEHHITCSWTASSGPSAIKVYCEIKIDGAWSSYGSPVTLTAIDQAAGFVIKGGEGFRLKVKRTSGSYGDCSFGVTLI